MGYINALRVAGAEVHENWTWGDYQGSWVALVTYQGVTGLVHGAYGSCSGCDHFEAEFGYDSHLDAAHNAPDQYVSCTSDPAEFAADCVECVTLRERLRTFGAEYLSGLVTLDKCDALVDEWQTEVEEDRYQGPSQEDVNGIWEALNARR